MKTKNSLLIALALIGLSNAALRAQIAINNTAATPDASAILDLKTGNGGVNKGFLPQAVSLTDVTVAAPVTSPATGLIVYSSTAPAGGDGAGYYYWNGTAWASMNFNGTGAKGEVTYWGGSNSVKGDTNLYWDNVNYSFGVGTSHPLQPLDINYSTPTTAKFGGYLPVFLVANQPMVGFNAYWGGLGTTYYSTDYAGMIQFNQNLAGGFQFLTAPSGVALTHAVMTPAMTITNTGSVGIGTATPSSPLQVTTSLISNTAEFDNSTNAGTAITGYATGPSGSWGVYGVVASASGTGVMAVSNAASGAGNASGVDGVTSQSKGFGAYGLNTFATPGVGIGVYGAGSGALGTVAFFGEGVFGEGKGQVGVLGRSNSVSAGCAGGYFDNNYASYASDYVYVGYNNGGTEYKIIGAGSVSTIVRDNNNVRRVMACPEAPEILFQDYGSATLSNGKVHVDLDPTYAKNITVNQKHALRVMVTLNDQCNGVYVTNRTATGFDVVELNNGTSNASFTYEVIANRADEYDANGNLISKYADNRFVEGPGPLSDGTESTSTVANPLLGKPAPAVYVPAPASNNKSDTK